MRECHLLTSNDVQWQRAAIEAAGKWCRMLTTVRTTLAALPRRPYLGSVPPGGQIRERWRLYAHVARFRIADHLSGVAYNFPEPGSWLNEEITCCAPMRGIKLTISTEPDTVEAVR